MNSSLDSLSRGGADESNANAAGKAEEKALAALYGSGTGGTVDPQRKEYLPLFHCIEEAIAAFDASERRLTDAEVALALNALGMNPEAPSADPLIIRIQSNLLLTLGANNYSRQELRQALRRIGRSVNRHTESGRGRAYLDFIAIYVGKGKR